MRRFMFFSGKAVLSRTSFSLFVIGCIYLSSCEDELERGKTSTSISFTPVIQSSWGPSARTMTGTDMPQDSVSSLQGGRTSLYLHTLYTDSIALPPSDSRPDRGVLTRATPIKDVNMYESFGVSAYSYT
ncbi:fimbrillin family protein, partial [Bacteroides fragilis]